MPEPKRASESDLPDHIRRELERRRQEDQSKLRNVLG